MQKTYMIPKHRGGWLLMSKVLTNRKQCWGKHSYQMFGSLLIHFLGNFFYWIWDSFERKNMSKHSQLSQAVAFFQTIQLLRLSSLLKHDNLWSSRKEIVCINFQNEADHPVFSQYIFSLGSKIRGKKAKYQDQCLCKSNHCWHYTRGQLNRKK